MNNNSFTNNVLSLLVGIIIGYCITNLIILVNKTNNPSSPVERIEIIDSLTKVNDSIKIKVEKLDSVKNAKIIEVSTLDNDSTLKLFYKLVKE